MIKDIRTTKQIMVDQDLALVNKIYESFEALEETLGMLKLEEPLFITYIAKKSFASNVFKDARKNNELHLHN